VYLIKNILDSLNRDVLNQLDLASSISHPGENGRARENIIKAYLRRLISSDFGIDTGFVIDSKGEISRQIDLVIYRKSYYPIFEIGGIKHFIVESVVAVIENKASIKSADNLNSALNNLKSVKVLDRVNFNESDGSSNYIVNGPQHGAPVNRNKFEHQVFAAIVTECSLQEYTFKKVMFQFFRDNSDRDVWPNMYVDVRNFFSAYIKNNVNNQNDLTVIPREAECLFVTTNNQNTQRPPLLDFSQELVNFLRVASVIDYKPTSYLYADGGENKYWKLE